MEGFMDQSGGSQSTSEISQLIDSSRRHARVDSYAPVTLIGIAFCGLVFLMVVAVAILVTRERETFDVTDDARGVADRGADSPMGSGSSSDSAPLPDADRAATMETPPSTTPGTVAPTPPPMSTTKPTPVPVTVIARTTPQSPPLPPPATPPPMSPTKSTPVPVTVITRTTTPQAPPPPPPPQSGSSIKPQSLLCTFGYMTNYRTKYPADGVCDYIFYDSMYKNHRNTLLGTWGIDMSAILTKALQTDPAKTQFGMAFAFEHRRTLIQDLANTTLKKFWDHKVFHFGIIDCPAHGTKQADMDEVFAALKALDDSVQLARASGNTSYIVLGAVSHTGSWNNYYRDKFGGVFKPDLFISLGHQIRGDPERSSCVVTPPTILEKPEGLADAHDLYDAARALASVASQAGGPRLSLSVSLAGRWSKLLPTSKAEIFSACEKGTPRRRFFGSYTEVCKVPPFSTNLLYEAQRYAVRTYDPGTQRMFVYDDEKALCQKLCLAKVNLTDVAFGVAVYDLDYEDTDDTCSNLNSMGAYSRFQAVSYVAKFLANHFTDPSKLSACSSMFR